jgi:hypothetical protein
MATHVDIVKNDWLAGLQYPLATLTLEGGDLRLDARDPEHWHGLLEELAAEDDIETAFSTLHTRRHGSVLFATEPHDEASCPFHGPPVYLTGQANAGSASAVAAGR